MAKNLSKLEELSKENEARQAERQDKISKLQTECYNAVAALAKANNAYEKAKKKLDSASMIEAKKEVSAAEEVVNMFKETLNAVTNQDVYSPEEVDSKVRELCRYAGEVNDAASRDVCKLLVQVRKRINDAVDIMDCCNCLIDDIAGPDHHWQKPGINILLANVSREIKSEETLFREYFTVD